MQSATTDVITAPPEGAGWWRLLRDAVRGVPHDYTRGPVSRAILLLAIPMVIEMAMESIFAVADVFFVARLGPVAVATVGLTESLLALIYTVAMGLSIGVTATVARRIGERNSEGAAHAAAQAVVLGVLVAAGIAAVGAGFAPTWLRLMGASEAVLAEGTGYARLMLGTDFVIILPFLLNAVFRGAGDAAIAMRSLVLANGVNIVLDPVLIFGLGPIPAYGVTGAAAATVIGRGIGVAYQLRMLTNGRSRVRVERRHAWWDPPALTALVRLSGSGTFQVFVATASWIGLIRVLATFGSDVVAGYTIGIRVILFAIMPAWGLSNAAATMVGQALGAKDPARAERAVWIAAGYNLAFLGLIGTGFFLGAPAIIGGFNAVGAVREVAILCLRVVALGFLFYGVGMVMAQAFNGAGDTSTPLRLNLLCYWALELPLAYTLAKVAGLGPTGAFAAVVASNTTFTVLAVLIFRRGKWKLTAV